MVRKVVLTARSRSDLKGICDHVADADPVAALKLGDDLLDRIERLADFPRMGRLYCRSARGDVHALPCRGYRVFYLVKTSSEVVEVVHIRHDARDEPDFLG